MTDLSTRAVRRPLAIGAAIAALILLATGTPAKAHPEPHKGTEHDVGLGLTVNTPETLAGFHPGVQWGGTAKIDSQTANLVYAGTGCTPASYAPVASQVRGNIAFVDDRVSADGSDQCPTYTFVQKVRSAEAAGAIAFVQITREGAEPRSNATAVASDIPALELERTDALLAVRDAVIGGTGVNATMTPIPTLPAMQDIPCVDGKAGPFECDGIDLLSFVPQGDFNGAGVSDIWGWTDPQTRDEYVFLGKTNGVAFFRVTDPKDPVYLGELPNAAAVQQIWHDAKVFNDHAYIVSESEPHGMTVFDLTRLRGVTEPRTWNRDGFYPLPVAAHNVAINEESGYAYIVGGNAALVAPDHCLSGLHMVDINSPKEPRFAGCYVDEGGPGTGARAVGSPATEHSPAAYVHDTQCVIYRGPDKRYTGREICFNAAEDKVVIADVTDKLRPVTLGVTDYPNVSYAHQGWLTEDQAYFILNDELDETTHKINTRTVVLDVSDLTNPKLHFEHQHDTTSIDHNNYVHEGLVYQSNYTSGLRVLDTAFIGDAENPRLEQVGFFDTFPAHSDPTFDGTWSNYPFFESGTIAVSGIDEGLFLLKRQQPAAEPAELTLTAEGELQRGVHTVHLTWQGAGTPDVAVFRDGDLIATVPNSGSYTDSTGGHGRATYTYRVCESGGGRCSNDAVVRFGGAPER